MMEEKDFKKIKGYNGNILLKSANQDIEWTPLLVKEFIKCTNDPVYFIEKYMKIVNVNKGLTNFKLYPYQHEMIESFAENRFTVCCTARQAGKALDLNTEIPTIDGWTTIRDLKVGDYIFNKEGVPTKVLSKSEIFHKNSYRVLFSDNTFVDVCEDHLWSVYDNNKKNRHELHEIDTKTIINNGLYRHDKENFNEYRYAIPLTKPVQYKEKSLPIDPYLLGLWLGDGTSRDGVITCHENDINHYKSLINEEISIKNPNKTKNHIKQFRVTGLFRKLRLNNLLKNKHIPDIYKQSSIEQRISLLKGIMDTDGYNDKNNRSAITLSTKNIKLLDDLKELIDSLGIKCSVYNSLEKNKFPYRRFSIASQFNVFSIPRKSSIWTEPTTTKSSKKQIIEIKKIDTIPTQCIVVDSPCHTFLCTRNYIVTHNSVTVCGFILWYILFHTDKTVALLANKGDTAREIMGKIRQAYQHLPKWLQQGVAEWNKGSVELENNSRVIATSTSSDNIRGYTINLLFLDEAAFIENWDTFFTSVYPTISSGNETKIILVSTPNGMNHFYATWINAIEGKNGYNPIKVSWTEVPGRDQKWKNDTLAAMNFDIEKFAQEYEVEFLGSSGTLISGWKLKELVHQNPIMQKDGLVQYSPPTEGHVYIMVCDVSRGKGLDYSAFQLIDVSEMPYQQVCVYRSNNITPIDYAEIIHRAAIGYNNASVLVEVNDIGEQVSHSLHYDFGYENVLFTENAGRSGKRITGGFGSGSVDKGIRTTKIVKSVGCSLLKLLIEQNQLIINDFNTINELSTFSKKGNSYEAEPNKHDDLVMCLVLFGWLSEQQYFKDYTNINTLLSLREKSEEDMEQDMAPCGFIMDGRVDYDESFEEKSPDAWMWREYPNF